MTTISRHELPVLLSGARAPVWWGMVILVAIEVTAFASLISGYFYLRLGAPEWPPADVPVPDLVLPIVSTVVLFVSSVAVFWATRGLQRGKLRCLKIGMGIGIGLEVVFFVLKLMISTGGTYDWSTNAYGSIFWTINWLHTGHVVVAILMASVAEVLALQGYFSEHRRLGVQVVNIYWQFVGIIWAPVFVVLFLVPRWS